MRKNSIRNFFLYSILMMLLTLSVISWDRQWDLTADKRYTLHPLVKEMSVKLQEPLNITVYLDGNVPPSFRNYFDYLEYYISELRRYNRRVGIDYRNPTEGDPQKVAEFRTFLSDQGIEPIRRRVRTQDELSQNLLYPYISLHNSEELVFINLLEPQIRGRSEEENLIVSQLAFEGKFLKALRRLATRDQTTIHVLGFKKDLLAEGYNRDARLGGHRFIPGTAERLLEHRDSLDGVLVVLKGDDLSRRELLAVDMVSAVGKPVIWCIDKFEATLDSLRETGNHLAVSNEYMVEDYLFNQGIRISPGLVMDLQSSRIPQVAGDAGSNARTVMLQYPFHHLYIPGEQDLPMSRVSTPVALYFVSPIEILSFPESVSKSPLLTTSRYTQVKTGPALLDFSFLSVEPDPDEYNLGVLTTGVVLEGNAKPYFENRLTQDDGDLLAKFNLSYGDNQRSSVHVVIGDADFAIPQGSINGGFYPVGYNNAERFMYEGNAQLLSNIFESLLHGNEILELSNKTSSLSIIDLPRYEKNARFYQFMIAGIPLITLLLLYLSVHWYRKFKYAR